MVTTKTALKYSLDSKQEYVVGEPVMITFTLNNQTNVDLWVLAWNTPLEGLKSKNLLVTCDGKEILYEGRMVKRSDPTRLDYICINAGKSASIEVDLSLAYTLPVADECRVEFKGRIHDFTDAGKLIPRKRDSHQGIHVSGNIVSFRLIDFNKI